MSRRARESEVEINSLIDLLNNEEEGMRLLFAKALNLYVSPGADARSDSEKLGCLKKAIEDSLQ